MDVLMVVKKIVYDPHPHLPLILISSAVKLFSLMLLHVYMSQTSIYLW